MHLSPIDSVSIEGTHPRFNIVHQDNGIGFDVRRPFNNIVQATISRCEMHIPALPMYDLKVTPIERPMFGPVGYRGRNSPRGDCLGDSRGLRSAIQTFGGGNVGTRESETCASES